MSRSLVVFDFDWSLINTDSDRWVLASFREELGDAVRARVKAPDYPGWPQLMDEMLHQLHQDGVRRDQIDSALRKVPIFEEMREVIQRCGESAVDLRVLSDANVHYITTILEAQNLRHLFDRIISNHADFEGERLRVRPFHGHECGTCPANLCKGTIMQQWLGEGSYGRVVYVGDGSNDFCACKALPSGSFILARRNYRLHRLLSGPQDDGQADARSEFESCEVPGRTVLVWGDGVEAKGHFDSLRLY